MSLALGIIVGFYQSHCDWFLPKAVWNMFANSSSLRPRTTENSLGAQKELGQGYKATSKENLQREVCII